MKIQSVKIHNFKGIEEANVELNGHNCYLIGQNGSGKTSFIDAVFNNIPQRPLKNGARKGNIEINIGEYIVNYTFSNKNEKAKLEITDAKGQLQKAPATLLSELFGIIDFNIDEFLSLSESKQVEKIKTLCKIDWSDIDARYKELYDDRRIINKQLDEIDARLKTASVFMQDPGELIDMSALNSELTEAIAKNKKRSDFANKVDTIKNDLLKATEREGELLKLLAEVREQKVEFADKILKGTDWLNKNAEIDTDRLLSDIDQANKHNDAVNKYKVRRSDVDKGKELQKELETIESELLKIKELKQKELESTDLKVKGLTFDENGLYLDGLPFKSDQINTARRIIAGLELSYHMLKDVKIARFDGSLLDKNSMEIVRKWASERDLQLFVELVDREGGALKINVEEE